MEHENDDCCEPKEKKKEKKTGMRAYLLVGLAILILVFAVGQTMQIKSAQERVFVGSGTTGSPAAPTPSARPATIPAMVGGC